MPPPGLDCTAHRQNLAVNLALGVVTTAVIIVLLELFLRLFVPQWAPARSEQHFWRYDELLGWAHVPHKRGTLNHRDFSVTVSINSHGLRGREYSTARIDGKRRLLVLGDSFGWGYGVEDNEIFSALLEQRYPNWEIMNASVCGYGTDQELLYYQLHGIQYRPDVVLLLFYSNDFYDNSNTELFGYNKPRFTLVNGNPLLTNTPVPKATRKQYIRRYLLANTIFLAQLYSAGVALKEQLFEQKPVSASIDTESIYGLTKSILFSLDDLIRANSARLVVVSVPTTHERVRRFLSQSTASRGVPYLPLDEAFSRTSERVTFAHDHHWNPTGHRIAAQAIEAFLRQHRILP